MDFLPDSLRPGGQTPDVQSPDPPLFIPPPFNPIFSPSPSSQAHHHEQCQCTCGLCYCRTRVLSPLQPPTPVPLHEPDVDTETIGPLSTIGPSTIGQGPHVTNIDPFNFKSPSVPPTELSVDLLGLSLGSPPPPPVPFEPIGDPAFAPSPTGDMVPPFASPLPFPGDSLPTPMPMPPQLPPSPFPFPEPIPVPEETPPPPRPDFNTTLMDPPDFPPVHRKTVQVILRIKPVFVECLDELYDILPKLDALTPDSPSPSVASVSETHSKQDVCMDLEECIKNLWFVLPPRHSCDDTLDCRHWHQRFIERMEQVAEKLVSFLDEIRHPPEMSKFSFRMDQYRRVLEKWIKKFEQYHSLIKVPVEP